MESLGEQIRKARREKRITQDELAAQINVSRSAVANWEQDRRMPDWEMVQRLSEILGTEFRNASETGTAETADSEEGSLSGKDALSGTGAEPETEASGAENADSGIGSADGTPDTAAEPGTEKAEEGASAKAGRGKWRWAALAGGLAAVALLVWFVLVPALKPKELPLTFMAKDGTVYTREEFSEAEPNQEGKAYLTVTPKLSIMTGESTDYYIYDFDYFEKNGIALKVDSVEAVYFSKKGENISMRVTAEDIQANGLPVDIPAYGKWTYQGGLPVQKTLYGVGEKLYCTDENGSKLVFHGYLPFPET